MDFGRFLVVRGDRESYDDDNPPRGKLDRRPSNWNIKDCQLCHVSLCPAVRYCDRSAYCRPARIIVDRVATEGLTDLLLEYPSTLALAYQDMHKPKLFLLWSEKKKRPNIPSELPMNSFIEDQFRLIL